MRRAYRIASTGQRALSFTRPREPARGHSDPKSSTREAVTKVETLEVEEPDKCDKNKPVIGSGGGGRVWERLG